MHIAVFGPNQEDDLAWSISAALRRLGHDVTELGQADLFPKIGGRRMRAAANLLLSDPLLGRRATMALADRAIQTHADLVITVQSLHPSTVSVLAKRGVACALWFPDAASNMGSQWMFEAPYLGVFLKDPLIVQRLNAVIEAPIHYLPEACDPVLHHPIDGDPIPSIAVAGNIYPTRARLLERLHGDGFPLALYGSNDAAQIPPLLRSLHAGRYLRGYEKAAVFRNSIAVLNNLHPAELASVNNRLFEAAACGGLVISEFRESIADFFKVPGEVWVYENYAELASLLSRALEDPAARIPIGDAASKHALKEHTYDERLRQLLSKLGFSQSK